MDQQQLHNKNELLHGAKKDWRFWLIVAGLIGSGYVAVDRIKALAADQETTKENVAANEEEITSLEKDLIVIQKDGEARDKEIETLNKGQGIILQKIERSGEQTSQAFKDLLDEIRKSRE